MQLFSCVYANAHHTHITYLLLALLIINVHLLFILIIIPFYFLASGMAYTAPMAAGWKWLPQSKVSDILFYNTYICIHIHSYIY